jgi:hypothetical protein
LRGIPGIAVALDDGGPGSAAARLNR